MQSLDSFQILLAEMGGEEVESYFEGLDRAESMRNSARNNLLKILISGGVSKQNLISYLESHHRADLLQAQNRLNLVKHLKSLK